MNPIDSMWTEKYRPAKLDDMVCGFKDKIKKYMQNFDSMQHLLLYSLVPGTGKCLGIDTPILMFDGSIKKVQDVVNGDKIMGPDSKCRIVQGVTSGRSMLYNVKQKTGNDYIVNKDHILSLVRAGTEQIFNVETQEYMTFSKGKKASLKGYKAAIEFDNKKVKLDPYLLGLWLGDDNDKSQRITKRDVEIVSYLEKYAIKLGYNLYTSDEYYLNKELRCTERNIISETLRKYNVINNKHIPVDYLINDRKNRLMLLAGLLDSKGYVFEKGYWIDTYNEILAEQMLYLVRSLGFRAGLHKKTYISKKYSKFNKGYEVTINGEVWKIPCKVKRKQIKEYKRRRNCLRCGVEVTESGVGEYYGFTLDKDGLFLLGDFTVTHNTTLAKVIINELGADSLEMNSSDDRKIEAIREKVNAFVRTKSSKPGMRRIVLMDEADGLTNAAQAALRTLMETYASNALFILTCNYVSKILPAIQSRCGGKIEFTLPNKNKILEYLKSICEHEGLKYTDAGLNRIIEINYPSIRNCVQVLQSLWTEGKDVTENTAESSDEIYQSLWNKITKDKDWKSVKNYIFSNTIDVRQLNKFFWFKAVDTSYIKMIQITSANEDRFVKGGENIIIFITSLIEMTK
jgi:DNA polymerase III delta prime subunit